MSTAALAEAHRLLSAAVDALAAAVGPGAGDGELLSALTVAEGAVRRLDQVGVGALAMLERRGVFAERGYRNSAAALIELVGWERSEARRRLTAAQQVCPRVGVDGSVLPARMPATAERFAKGAASLRHVEAIAQVLGSGAAARLRPTQWAAVEATLAEKAGEYAPAHLLEWGSRMVELLDQDGPEPDERPPTPVNELRVRHHRGGPGGTITGRFDDAAMFDAIASVIDAQARPRTGEDERTPAQRQAEALADVCGYVLDHGDVPACGGRRPHLTVTVRLEELEQRARTASLDFGGALSPEGLRMLCCDAAVVPVVFGGASQPLDVGRMTRVVPDGIRRAVAARDRGCARCGKPPSWCEIHHVLPWENGGPTSVENCVMVCRSCHRLIHHGGWEVRLLQGVPEFVPPAWIDPLRRPRRRPPRLLVA